MIALFDLRKLPRWLRYLLAAGLTVVALLLRLAFTSTVGNLPTYITFYPAVMIVAVLLDFWAGIIATAVSALVTVYWLLPPVGQWKVESPADVVGLILFISMGALMSLVAELYHRASRKAEAFAKELAVREGQAREHASLQTIFDAVNIGMLLVDEHGAVLRANQALVRWTGSNLPAQPGGQPGDLLGCVHALSSPEGCGFSDHCPACPIRGAVRTALESGQPVRDVETETTLVAHGQNARLWVAVSADPVVIEGRRCVILALNNIAARKQAEAQLQASKEAAERTAAELARSNKDLEQFAYVSSHDLQEPLRMVTGFMQLFEQKYREQIDATGRQYIDFAVGGARRMQQLIEDLLTFSRAGTRGVAGAMFDCGQAVRQALQDLRGRIEESGAQVTCGDMPQVRGDAGQIAQVFQNVIGNAIKFRGQEPPRIHVEARREGRHWVFSIRDNGIGVEKEFHEKIFVIFQRLHSRDKYPGTGIGLAICKRIIDRHGGRIWVESQPGQGSTFCFTLPSS